MLNLSRNDSFSLESYMERYQLNPKTSTEPLLQPYEVQEAFQKYLVHKILSKKGETKKPDHILAKVWNELEPCSSMIPREHLNRLSYLVHATSSERELLASLLEDTSLINRAGSLDPKLFAIGFHQIANSFTRWELASKLEGSAGMHPHFQETLKEHPFKIEKMEQDLLEIPNSSLFKKYLVSAHALDKKENIRYVLHVLSRVLKIDLEESEDLKTCNHMILNALYSRFLHVLETGKYDATAKTKFERINRTKKSCEQKIEETLEFLNEMTGVSGVQKLKDALCIQIEEKDCADFPGVGFTWNPKIPLLEQRDASFNALCLATLLEISHKRGIDIDHSVLVKAQKRSDFSGLKDVALQMPKLGDRIRDKVIKLREDLGLQTPSGASTYDLYYGFKQAFKERYVALKERVRSNALQSLLLEEMYLNQNTQLLLKIESVLPLSTFSTLAVIEVSVTPSPTTTAETGSVTSTDLPSPGKPEPVKDFQTFKDWIYQNERSVLSHFVFQKRLFACSGDESQLLDMARFAVELYVDLLKQEASMLKEPFPQVLSSIDELEIFSTELAYKKFLKGVAIAERKYKNSTILNELHKISEQSISTQEKRALCMQKLEQSKEEVPLEKLLGCLAALFTRASSQSSADIKRDGFSSQKAKKAAFEWLSNSSFLHSLEIDIGTKNNPRIEKALLIFRAKIKDQIQILNLPPIYLSLLDDFIKQGDLDGLKRLFYEVTYERYAKALKRVEYVEEEEVLRQLSNFDATLSSPSAFERVEISKHKMRELVKDEELLNYLLFQLEQFPYDPRKMSEKSKNLISKYLQEKSSTRPFDRYLQENRFSWFGHDEGACNWFAYLYEQFSEQLRSDAKKSKYDTARLLALEVEDLDPFDLTKLDQLALCIRAPTPITVRELYRFGFVLSVEEALRNPQCERNHQNNFESMEDISMQVSLLDHLSRSLRFSYLVHPTITNGSSRSLEIGYDFFKQVMKQPNIRGNKGALHAFFVLHFLCYSQDWINYISKEQEGEVKKLEEFEALMQGDLSGSPLKEFLESDQIIDSSGRCIGLFSLMPLRNLEPYMRTLKTFIEINSGSKKPSPYLSPDSWQAVLQSTNQLLKEGEDLNNLVSCYPEQIDSLIEETISKDVPGSFSDCLRAIGVRQRNGMGSDGYYHQYLLWEAQAVQYFVSKLTKLETKKESLFDGFDHENDRRIPSFKRAVNSIINQEMSTHLLESLKSGIEDRDWEVVNEVADQILYMEYRIALIELIICHYQSKMVDALKTIRFQTDEIKVSYRWKIEASLNNLPKFLSAEHQNELKSILENDPWIEKNKSSIEANWNWALGKMYLKNFPDIHLDPKDLTLYEKQAILDDLFSDLAESLLKEVQDLGMDEGYRELIKIANYEECLILWDWIVEEVSYQKCLFKIQEARNQGADMSMFDDLENRTKNCTIHEKTALVLRTLEYHKDSSACKSLLSSLFLY